MGGGIGREDRRGRPYRRGGEEGAVLCAGEVLVLCTKVFARYYLAYSVAKADGIKQVHSHCLVVACYSGLKKLRYRPTRPCDVAWLSRPRDDVTVWSDRTTSGDSN